MLFTALIVLIFRIGAAIPVPFTNITGSGIVDPTGETFMNYLSMMTGDAFNYGTIFAMSVTPYINSSIIIQLLTVAIPALEKLSKEGEEGRKKIATITRYTTIALALLQSTAYFIYLRAKGYVVTDAEGQLFTGFSAVLQGLVVITVLTAGSAFIMWLGEQVNDKGIGNGVSIILFAGIVARMPTLVYMMYAYLMQGGAYFALVPIVLILLLAMVAYIVWMDNAERRIPVQYAKRVVGRKIYGGQNTHIPLKVNSSGVLPIIFAMSMLQFPATIVAFIGKSNATKGFAGFINNFSKGNTWGYVIVYAVLIVLFTFFYNIVYFDPNDMANNLKKNGGFVPGIRPGQPTADFIKTSSRRLTWFGSIFLAVLAVFPTVIQIISSYFSKEIGSVNLWFGGTTVLILVGVALETVKQLEAQLLMRNYKGFLD